MVFKWATTVNFVPPTTKRTKCFCKPWSEVECLLNCWSMERPRTSIWWTKEQKSTWHHRRPPTRPTPAVGIPSAMATKRKPVQYFNRPAAAAAVGHPKNPRLTLPPQRVEYPYERPTGNDWWGNSTRHTRYMIYKPTLMQTVPTRVRINCCWVDHQNQLKRVACRWRRRV